MLTKRADVLCCQCWG